MRNSVSQQSLYMESEEEDDGDEEKVNNEEVRDDDGNTSDSDRSSIGNEQHTRTNSYNTTWPQSYRQSIDMLGSVPSPSIGFLGSTPSRFSGSFLPSSLTRRHTPETLSFLDKSLLPTVENDLLQQQQEQEQHRHSSHSLLPPISENKIPIGRVGQEHISSRVSHESRESPESRQSSYGQAVLNGMNVLCGVGILSTPYAVKEGGWMGMSILFLFAALSWYTGILLRYCLDSEPALKTYPDIGQAAFGTLGRFAISAILYVELYACCVEYIILESDNLSNLFGEHLSVGGFVVDSKQLFAVMATLVVLPTVWLRDLSIISYISAGGVIASVLVVASLFWAGLVDHHIEFPSKETTLNLTTLPVAIGLYGYCYSGHAVFPNIYTSMAKPIQYPSVLLTSFSIVTVMYAGVAVMGYKMFGDKTESQFTLNLPKNLVASKIAVWTTVVNPFTKFALVMNPVALSLEELIPTKHLKRSCMYAILIRTALVISTLIVALCIPFFGLVMALIGSLLTMFVTLILPCACFLSILRGRVTWLQGSLCLLIIIVGIISCIFGTISALSKIIQNLS